MCKLCDMKMRAAVVFLNFVEEADNIGRLLKESFLSEKEYVYYGREAAESLLNSGSITKELEEKKEKRLLDVPERKFVFAFYLELFKTDKTMIDKIHRLMKDFSENLNPANASQLGYLICYRQDWEKESGFAREDLQKSISFNVINTVHAEYLLYRDMFGSYQMQETALVRYLHMLSRDTDVTKAALSNEKGYLCAFAFERYDEEAAEINKKQIQMYNNWLYDKQDKRCDELCGKIVGHVKKLVKEYADLLGDFAYWQKLFPRKRNDYKRMYLFWHRLNSTQASHIEEEKRKCEDGYLQQLGQQTDWNELKTWIRNNVTYYNFKKLQNADARKKFMEDVQVALMNEYKELEYQEGFRQAIIKLYEKKIMENLNEWEDWRREVEEQLHRKQEEEKENGKYKDLPDCLTNIKRNIYFSLPPAIVRQGRTDWLLLKEEIPKVIFQNTRMDIEDKDMYLYPDLKPWKVQMISIVKYKPDDNLIDQILKKGKKDERSDHY